MVDKAKNSSKRRKSTSVETVRDRINSFENKRSLSNEKETSSKNKASIKETKNNTNKSRKKNIRLVRIIGLILLPKYFRNSWKELKQVSWPNFKLSRQLTFAVIIFAVFFGISIAGLDYGLTKIFKIILLK